MKDVPDPTDTHVGARVRMGRLMLGISQTDLAEAVGVTFQQVQKYEKGKNRISASRLQQMSQVLEVPIHFFFDGLPSHSSQSSYVSNFLSTSDGLSLVTFFMQITDPTLRRRLVHLVEAIANGDG